MRTELPLTAQKAFLYSGRRQPVYVRGTPYIPTSTKVGTCSPCSNMHAGPRVRKLSVAANCPGLCLSAGSLVIHDITFAFAGLSRTASNWQAS